MEEGHEAMDTEALMSVGETLTIERIQEMIPHRYPMLMIDRVVDVVRGVRATGIKNVTINEFFFRGIFRPSR